MRYETTWHADGLRWIASLFLDAANALERSVARPCERSHADLLAADDPVDNVRHRIPPFTQKARHPNLRKAKGSGLF